MTHVVIMAGGIGSRLFPLSTPEHPKQFLDLLGGGRTMIQMTCDRFRTAYPGAEFWVVTSAEYVHFVVEQLPDIPLDHILSEPVPRSTAPCIAYASWKIAMKDPSGCMIVTPADAYVPDYKAFSETVVMASDFAVSRRAMVCLGISPSSPHTGYGYIRMGGKASEGIFDVESFKEKPDLQTAERYLADGGFLWNAGIFVWRVETILRELRTYVPQICSVMDALKPVMGTPEESEALEALFPTCDKISIDYAVMEKSDAVFVAPGDWFWSDLGNFEALEAVKKVGP